MSQFKNIRFAVTDPDGDDDFDWSDILGDEDTSGDTLIDDLFD